VTTTAAGSRTNGQRTGERARSGIGRGPGRHRQLPLVVVGVLLVFGFALAFVDASLHLGSREEVLVVAQPVAAGQVLTSSDLRTARMSTGSGLDVVLSGDEASVIGRRVAVPLVAGSLLTAGEVGSTPPVGSGSDVVAVGLKAGAYPPELAPGDRVQVIPVTSGSSSSGGSPGSVTSGSPVAATVLSVAAAPADSDTPTVFSLQVSTSDADEVAALAAAGQASLVEVGAGS
jgi:Flp pilus assembly protein CpaB